MARLDEAIGYAEKALAEKSSEFFELKWTPIMSGLGNDSRWERIEAKLGLKQSP